jgi:hypothetical protein
VVTMWALRGAAGAFVTLLARCFPGAPGLGLDAASRPASPSTPRRALKQC